MRGTDAGVKLIYLVSLNNFELKLLDFGHCVLRKRVNNLYHQIK